MKAANSISSDLMDSLILSIVSFMNKAGMEPSEIERSFRIGLRDLTLSMDNRRKVDRKSSSEIGCDTIAGAVLRAWHRDPAYLDELANPLPLKKSGRGSTFSRLVKTQDPSADVESLARAMHRTRLIKKTGDNKLLPITSAATISQLHPFAVDHVVKTVLRLVETVTRNMRLVDSKHSLVERYAHIPDLDANEARAFSEFSRQQGAACLEAIEDWLEARRKGRSQHSSGKKASISAGMHVFAYLEQPAVPKRKRYVIRPSTSSRAARA